MQIAQSILPSADYKDFKDQNLSVEKISDCFAQASIQPYKTKLPLWRQLQTLLDSQRIDARQIDEDGVLLQGEDIPSTMLCEALEFHTRAFYNFYAQDKLMEYGFSTWSHVTNYYTEFYNLHSLLRLQARCLTHLRGVRGQFLVFPYESESYKYVLCRGPSHAHEGIWNLFFAIYDAFVFEENQDFESIFKLSGSGTAEEEYDSRVSKNYRPYEGYDEIYDPTIIPQQISEYDERKIEGETIRTLKHLTTDPDFKYYARAALRLKFTSTLLGIAARKNENMKALLDERKGTSLTFLQNVSARIGQVTIGSKLWSILK